MYVHRRVAFCPIDSIALSGILSGFTAVDECVSAQQAMGFSQVPHDEVVLRHSVTGTAEMQMASQVVHQAAGTVLLFGAGISHQQTVGRRPWHTRYIVLRGAWAEPLRALRSAGTPLLRPLDQIAATLIGPLAETVALALDQPPGWEWRCAARIATLVDLIMHEHATQQSQHGVAAAASRYLDAQPDRNWGVVAMAKAMGLSSRTLTQQFSAEVGIPPARWMREHRLARARLLLRQGLSVVAVAERMHFSSPFQLCRAYRSWAGHPPSQDRIRAPSHPTSSG